MTSKKEVRILLVGDRKYICLRLYIKQSLSSYILKVAQPRNGMLWMLHKMLRNVPSSGVTKNHCRHLQSKKFSRKKDLIT